MNIFIEKLKKATTVTIKNGQVVIKNIMPYGNQEIKKKANNKPNKILGLILFASTFLSAQNITLLQKANNADEAFAKTFTQDIYPNYQTIDSYKEGLYYSYILVPAGTSETEISDCKLGNPCQKGVTVKYKVLNGNYIFSSAKGDGASLFAFWTKEVQPAEKTTEIKTYKNKDAKVWYNLEPTPKTWMIVNMSDRSESQW